MGGLDRSVTAGCPRTICDVIPQIALVSCDPLLPEGDSGDAPLSAALVNRGYQVEVASWSDSAVNWQRFDLTVLRSTWDYTLRQADFLSWLPTVPRLHNPATVVAANSDKRYLGLLVDAGLPVVETAFSAPGTVLELPSSGQFVIKPAVGAGSRGAGRFDADQPGELDRAVDHAARLHALGRTVMVQPYLHAVDSEGETAMIYFDGKFSHAIGKGRMLEPGAGYEAEGSSLWLAENISPRTPSAAEHAAADRIIGYLSPSEPLLYARIDLLPTAAGPVLLEAELAEPSLFFDHHPGSAEVMAAAIARRIGA
ncbi:hypothetical protein BH10ACT8_BH10ACT8_12450 [soil metagenome]